MLIAFSCNDNLYLYKVNIVIAAEFEVAEI